MKRTQTGCHHPQAVNPQGNHLMPDIRRAAAQVSPTSLAWMSVVGAWSIGNRQLPGRSTMQAHRENVGNRTISSPSPYHIILALIMAL
jgi:hypothetical protein